MPPKSNPNKRKGTNLVKRAITKSIAQSSGNNPNRFVHGDGQFIDLPEEILMAREEQEQTMIDKFWGIDKDLKDRNVEITQMMKEDSLSRQMETRLHIQNLHRIWDDEFVIHENYMKRLERERQARQRIDHLRLINSPLSMEEVLQEIWNIDPQTRVPSRGPATGGGVYGEGSNVMIGEGSYMDNDPNGMNFNGLSIAELTNSQEVINNSMNMGLAQPGFENFSLSLEPMRMSLHLEGLQRGRDIVDNAAGQYKQLLKEIKTNSSIALGSGAAEQQPSIASQPFNSKLGNGSVSHGTVKTANTSKSKLQALQEIAKVMKMEQPVTLVSDALEGHPKLQWDQEAILYASFQALDIGTKGYLTREDVSRVSWDPAIHSYLKYTVYWSVIKRREWSIFEQMFLEEQPEVAPHLNPLFPPPPSVPSSSHQSRSGKDNAWLFSSSSHSLPPISEVGGMHGNNRPSTRGSTTSNAASRTSGAQYVRPPNTVSYTVWLETAILLSRESFVHVKYIRTQAEHEKLCSVHYQNHSSAQSNRGSPQFNAESYDNEHFGMIRDFRAMRQLSVGDCVWVLHRNGVRWLPAVIEKVHQMKYPGHGDNGSVGNGNQNDMVLNSDASWASPGQRGGASSNASVSSAVSNGSRPSMIGSQDPLTAFIAKDRRSNPFPCYHYDVWYPLNEKELFRSRMATTSKQLLTLPSQSLAATRCLKPKPLYDEITVCSYTFDLIDCNATGVVELVNLITTMQSVAMEEIVDTSLVLTVIFRRTPPQIEERMASYDIASTVISRKGRRMIKKRKKMKQMQLRMPCLLPVLVDTFSGAPDDNDDGNDDQHDENSNGTFLTSSKSADPRKPISRTRSGGIPRPISGEEKGSEFGDDANGVVSLGCISKTDFLEFCRAVYVACKYDAERLKPLFVNAQ